MKIIRAPLARIAKIIRAAMGEEKNDEKWKKIDSVQVFNERTSQNFGLLRDLQGKKI